MEWSTLGAPVAGWRRQAEAEVERTRTRGTSPGVNRRLLGALTLWPLLYLVFFFIVVGIATVQGDGDPDDAEFLRVSSPFGGEAAG
jgi:hypothetical protein